MVHVNMIAIRPALEPHAIGNGRIPKACFWHTPIEFNEEMEDIEEVSGMNTQPETSRQLEISLTLLPVLKSWNLG
jgi:hypothetical protein